MGNNFYNDNLLKPSTIFVTASFSSSMVWFFKKEPIIGSILELSVSNGFLITIEADSDNELDED